MLTAANLFLSLFAVATLISQSGMDLFSGLFGLTALGLTVTRPEYRAHLFRRTGFEWIVGLWFLATFGSLVLGRDLVATPQWTKLADFKWLFLAVLVGRHLSFIRVQEQKILWHWIAFSVASVWAIAIFFLGYDPLHPHQPMDAFADGTVRTGGFLQQAIVFAQLYAVWLMIPIGLLVQDLPVLQKLRRQPLAMATIVDAAIWGGLALLLSFTRGIWLAVPVAVLIVLAIRRWMWALVMAVVGAVTIAGLAAVWPALQDRLLQAFQGADGERVWIWKANWQMFLDHPFLGVGYNHNVQLLPEYYGMIGAPAGLLESHAHNQYLQILTGTGVIGFLFYASFWILLLVRIIKRYRVGGQYAGWALGVIGALVVFLLGGAFESNFEHAKIRSVMALVLGLVLWLDDLKPAAGPGSSSSPDVL